MEVLRRRRGELEGGLELGVACVMWSREDAIDATRDSLAAASTARRDAESLTVVVVHLLVAVDVHGS